MSTSADAFRGRLAGLVAGFAGLATSYCVAMVMTIRDSPVVAVAELVIRLTPGPVVERAIQILGHRTSRSCSLVILVILRRSLFAWAGRLARRTWWAPTVWSSLRPGRAGHRAVLTQRGAAAIDLLPVAVGFATWLVCLSLLTEPLRATSSRSAQRRARPTPRRGPAAARHHTRRTFLIRAGVLVVGRGGGSASWAAWSVAGGGTSRRPAGCCGCPASRAPAGARAAASIGLRRDHAVGDADRRLLPDRHRDRRADDRARRLGAADPRDGRPRDRADLPDLIDRAGHRGLGDAQLRLQPGRRRPDRQRLVERRPDRRPARRGRRAARARTPCCRPPTTAGPAARRWPR